MLLLQCWSLYLPVTGFQRFFGEIMVYSMLPKNFLSLQSHTSSTILLAVQGFHKEMDKWNVWYRQSNIAETSSRPSSSSTVIQGHTNAVVWIEPITIMYGKEDKDHYSSGDEATNSKLFKSPWVQEREPEVQIEAERRLLLSTWSQRAIWNPRWIRSCDYYWPAECTRQSSTTSMYTKVIHCRNTIWWHTKESWTTNLKLAMNTCYNCWSDIGWVSPGDIPFSCNVRLDPASNIIYIYIYMLVSLLYMCLCRSSSCKTITLNESHSRIVYLINICQCLCVSLSVTYRCINHWTDLHKIRHVTTVWPRDEHGFRKWLQW